MNDAFSSLGIVLIISIALVYMILVILYESFITPIVRMASLPCAAIGALLILLLTKNTINMMTIIGIIMLDGLASKNGTLLIDYTNTLLKKGIPLKEALIEAGSTRLRPIIMTTVTMIVGMLPAAIAFGDGSELKKGMATVVIGGMITSTLLTPIIVPVVYTLINDFKEFLTKRLKKNAYVAEVSNYEA
jgi:HAE1 family hydrophobic/amphiphilic exporter-1